MVRFPSYSAGESAAGSRMSIRRSRAGGDIVAGYVDVAFHRGS